MNDQLLVVAFKGTLMEYLKFQIRHCIPLSLSDGKITLLAYLHLYKEAAVEKFLTDGHSKSKQSVENYLSDFRKEGLMNGNELNTAIHLTTDPTNYVYTFNVA